MSATIDIFLDLTQSPSATAVAQRLQSSWSRPTQIGSVARRVTVLVGRDERIQVANAAPAWTVMDSETRAQALTTALDSAGRDGVPLLVLFGAVDVSIDAVGVLRQCLDSDPMFGFALPRVGCHDRCCIARVSRFGLGWAGWLPRGVLAELPEHDLLTETVGPCVLVSPQVAGNFGPIDGQFERLPSALLHYMASARRCGFRSVLSNRTVIGVEHLTCDTAGADLLAPTPWDRSRLFELVPDLDRGWTEYQGGARERFERLHPSSRRGVAGSDRPSLLLDMRNLGPVFNGTTAALLGIANGLKALRSSWTVDLLANPLAAAFHDLKRAYPEWPVHRMVPPGPFTVAFRPTQPWHIQELADLHDASLFNAYLMLDTIAWDVVYAAPPNLDGTWAFMAEHADAVLFDSEFSRQRFLTRFSGARPDDTGVTHLSFDYDEYIHSRGTSSDRADGYILVVGNALDHKDVRETVATLTAGFPYRSIKVLGPSSSASSMVTSVASGEVPAHEIDALFANAQFVVFPSFYEGFGFPVITALAHGRTVFARRSALLDEVAGHCAPRGRLVAFDTREALVHLLGRLVHGEPVAETTLGQALGTSRPKSWRDVAQFTLAYLEGMSSDPSRSRWSRREGALRQVRAARA